MRVEKIMVKLAQDEVCKNITSDVERFLRRVGDDRGSSIKMLNIFVPHTTCAVILQEEEVGLIRDLAETLERVAPRDRYYRHDDFSLRRQNLEQEGEERVNGHAHVRASFFPQSLTIPVLEGKIWLGRWQQILFFDFDDKDERRERSIILTL